MSIIIVHRESVRQAPTAGSATWSLFRFLVPARPDLLVGHEGRGQDKPGGQPDRGRTLSGPADRTLPSLGRLNATLLRHILNPADIVDPVSAVLEAVCVHLTTR